MGLMDMLGKAAGGNSNLLSSVMAMVTQHEGGVGGLLSQLQSSGLSSQVQSWIGSGANLPVSAEQIKAALGEDKIGQVAQAAGISHDEAAAAVAKHLPDVIDKLTPNGTLPASGFEAQALAALKGKIFG